MPAAAFNTLAAVVVHAIGVTGYQTASYGIPAEVSGLLLNSITPKPTREKVAKQDRLGSMNRLVLFKNPQYQLEIDAEDYKIDGLWNGNHPGGAIARSDVGFYDSTTRHGFPDTGYFVFEDIQPGLRAGDQRTNKVTVTLLFTPDQTVEVITAP